MLKHVILACAAAFALSSAALAAPNTATMATPVSTSRTVAHSNAAGDATTCRTHRHAGASCACSKAPGRHGTAERQNGHTMCVVAHS